MIEFGRNTPVGNDIYTHVPGSKEVWIVSGGFDYNLNKEVTDYRSRDLFWDFPQSVSQVSLLGDGNATQLEQRDGKWYSGAVSLDTEKVASHINRIKGLSVQKFEADTASPADMKGKYGFDGKQQVVIVSDKGELTIKVGKKSDDNSFFVQTSERPNVYRVGKYNIDPLFKPVKEFVPTPPQPATATTDDPHAGLNIHSGAGGASHGGMSMSPHGGGGNPHMPSGGDGDDEGE